jgi:hypothetical protein
MINERMQQLAGVPLNEAKKTIKIEAEVWDNELRFFMQPHDWTVVVDQDAGVTHWTSRELSGFGTVTHPIDMFFEKNDHHGYFMIEMRKTSLQTGFVGLDKKNLKKLQRVLR